MIQIRQLKPTDRMESQKSHVVFPWFIGSISTATTFARETIYIAMAPIDLAPSSMH